MCWNILVCFFPHMQCMPAGAGKNTLPTPLARYSVTDTMKALGGEDIFGTLSTLHFSPRFPRSPSFVTAPFASHRHHRVLHRAFQVCSKRHWQQRSFHLNALAPTTTCPNGQVIFSMKTIVIRTQNNTNNTTTEQHWLKTLSRTDANIIKVCIDP